MRTCIFPLILIMLSSLAAKNATHAAELPTTNDQLEIASTDWPWWRGPLRNGTASAKQTPPTEFSTSKNLIWKAPIPGRGHGSPTVVGGQVFVATANEQIDGQQSLLCFDRQTGEPQWSTVVHASGGMQKNNKATAASSTPACDGQRVYINFPNNGGLYTSALSLTGELLWQERISDYVVHQGYGASPCLYQNLVIVTSDNKTGGAIAALDSKSGEMVWRRERPQKPNYPSPILVHAGGQDQVILVGCDQVCSYNPLTGATNWETEGATTECVTSTLTDGQLIYTSGGYPKNHMSAIRADGSTEVVWSNETRLYVPSLVIRDGYLYGVLDAGIAMCWKADTGEEMWKKRLGGTFSSSPVLVGDKIFVTNEGGEFFIFQASPEEFLEVAENKLGEQVFATPTICDSRIYHRVAHLSDSGERQEMLYCFGQ
ncbi:outer membrane protein assembly factor BamB family protein [Aureliella helgolandensis]|uniref:Outer membrane biogenesis protein BamB n=1 Tax=Aureliella helgolandensis TaxID=2527968 RepID=A0A518G0K3_9BACT|nr:PQQ-binding-like beta-propeller repeat protein [Aureliella helgolandensis]QDV22131.1 outer membrane biogenesis protein BamB [Aureliella helgolandensis]